MNMFCPQNINYNFAVVKDFFLSNYGIWKYIIFRVEYFSDRKVLTCKLKYNFLYFSPKYFRIMSQNILLIWTKIALNTKYPLAESATLNVCCVEWSRSITPTWTRMKMRVQILTKSRKPTPRWSTWPNGISMIDMGTRLKS